MRVERGLIYVNKNDCPNSDVFDEITKEISYPDTQYYRKLLCISPYAPDFERVWIRDREWLSHVRVGEFVQLHGYSGRVAAVDTSNPKGCFVDLVIEGRTSSRTDPKVIDGTDATTRHIEKTLARKAAFEAEFNRPRLTMMADDMSGDDIAEDV